MIYYIRNYTFKNGNIISKKKKNVPKVYDGANAIENNAETVGNEKITQGESK